MVAAKFLGKGSGSCGDYSDDMTGNDICHHVVIKQYTSILLVQLLYRVRVNKDEKIQ